MQPERYGRDVCGAPAAGKDQLLYSEVEGNLPPKAGEEEGREQGSRWGHGISVAANLPRCQMIDSSW